MTFVTKQNAGFLKSARSWGVLGLALALAVAFGYEPVPQSSGVSTLGDMFAQKAMAQEPRQAQPANPCAGVAEEALRKVQSQKDIDAFLATMRDCAQRTGQKLEVTQVGKPQSVSSTDAEAVHLVVTKALLQTGLSGGTFCTPPGLAFPFVWIGISWGAPPGLPPGTASVFHAATVQYETTRFSTLIVARWGAPLFGPPFLGFLGPVLPAGLAGLGMVRWGASAPGLSTGSFIWVFTGAPPATGPGTPWLGTPAVCLAVDQS